MPRNLHTHCGICNPKNKTLYFHSDPETSNIWCYCNKCDRGYSVQDYCARIGVGVREFLEGDFELAEAQPNTVQKMQWPAWYLPLFDPRAQKGLDYIKSRGLDAGVGDMFYDADSEGIVFPYYFGQTFVGAQIRFIAPRVREDGSEQKMDTLPGSRLGLIVWSWNQTALPDHIKGLIVCEGAFNAASLQTAGNMVYGSAMKNPWRCVALSGSGLSEHHSDILKEQVELGRKVILAPDADPAGLKFLKKAVDLRCITHYALPEDTEKDWNLLLQETGKDNLYRYFLKRIQGVDA